MTWLLPGTSSSSCTASRTYRSSHRAVHQFGLQHQEAASGRSLYSRYILDCNPTMHWLPSLLFLLLAAGLQGWRQEYIKKSHVFAAQNPRNEESLKVHTIRNYQNIIAKIVAAYGVVSGNAVRADDYRTLPVNISNENIPLTKAVINGNSDDFWYPPYMIGRWNTSLKFVGARFIDDIPLKTLASNENLPGFTKYSVIFTPDIGKDIDNVVLRYVQLDSHPREDHPNNIRNLMQSFLPDDVVVDSAPYSFQKARTWLSSPSNQWVIKYHDTKGNGTVELTTQKRNITVSAGSVQTIEFMKQIHYRQLYNSNKVKKIVSDYAINWIFAVPASLRDEFVTAEELAKTAKIIGKLNVLAYFQPTSDLYYKAPGKPAGVYTYEVEMNRLDNGGIKEEVGASTYPFVWREDGPVELDKYFNY